MANVLEGLNENQKRQILQTLKTELEPGPAPVGDDGNQNENDEVICDDRKLPTLVKFSGGKAKGDSSYRKWKFEVQELVSARCPESKIRRAIQKSLFGSAAESFMSIPKETSVKDILDKFDKLFQVSEDAEAIYGKFYSAVQDANESISEWYIRLESILDLPALNLGAEQKESMLRARFWKGLRKEYVKSSLRHKFDNNATSVQLLNAARVVSEEVGATAATSTTVQHQPAQTSGDQLTKLMAAIDLLTQKVEKLEKGQNSKLKSTSDSSSSSQGAKFKGKCHKCKMYGHKASDCRVKKQLKE